MASVNKVIIVGNLGRDPETRYMPNGEAVTNIAVATTESGAPYLIEFVVKEGRDFSRYPLAGL